MLLILVPLAIYTFTENDVYENVVNTVVFKKIIALLVTGIVVAFIHKGFVNPLVGEGNKFVTRGMSAIIWALMNVAVFSWINKNKDFTTLKKFYANCLYHKKFFHQKCYRSTFWTQIPRKRSKQVGNIPFKRCCSPLLIRARSPTLCSTHYRRYCF